MRISTLLMTVLLCLLANPVARCSDELIKNMIGEWTRRANKLESVRVRWNETEMIAAHSMLSVGGKPSVRYPLRDITNEKSVEFVKSNENIRYETNGPLWDVTSSEFFVRQYLSTWDGRQSMSLFGADAGRNPRFGALGYLHEPNQHMDQGNDGIAPVMLLWYAPRSHFQILSDLAEVVLEHSPGPGTNLRFTVNRQQGFSITRVERTVGDQPQFTLDIRYVATGDIWLPASWKGLLLSRRGQLKRQFDCRVNSFVTNVSIPPNDFQITFPVGTRITDQRSGRQYLSEPRGTRRPFTENDLANRPEYVRETRALAAMSPKLGSTKSTRNTPIMIGCAGVLIVAWGSYWYFRRS